LAGKRIEETPPLSEEDGMDGLRSSLAELIGDRGFDASIDGLLGMQASLPLRPPLSDWVTLLNECERISVRAAVDMPTGIGEGSGEDALRADFTYCTGIVKSPVVLPENLKWTGRLRYLDLGFFDRGPEEPQEDRACVLRSSALRMLRKLRPADCDKRDQGHLFLLAGSRELGGAALMSAQAALKAGVGLLTVGIPESLHPAFVARLPEAMWVPLPETPNGGLALEGLGKVRQFLSKATALAIGPGIGAEEESHVLVRQTLSFFDNPVVLDADALRPEIMEDVKNPERLVLTPHAGEFARIADSRSPGEYVTQTGSVLVLKGPHTQIVFPGTNHYSLVGSSLLARGGSGDLLTGILGSLLAKGTFDLATSASLAVLWHGRAAEVLARQHGQEAVYATDLLDYLSFAIRNDF
jgi:NAD(P)H-hydrate epimerase